MAKSSGAGGGLGTPMAMNVKRQNGDGNTPVTGEKHDQAKSMKITASQNRSGSGVGPAQPTRQDGGNTPVTGESHGQERGSTIPASSRF